VCIDTRGVPCGIILRLSVSDDDITPLASAIVEIFGHEVTAYNTGTTPDF
jgi:hypothetical protein